MTDQSALAAEAAPVSAPRNPGVWIEIPASDYERAIAFYETVFQTRLVRVTGGPNPFARFEEADGYGTGAHIYPGKPAGEGQGTTVHLAVPDRLEDAARRCTDAGGHMLPGVIDIPHGRFSYAIDTEGNSIGLFEPNA